MHPHHLTTIENVQQHFANDAEIQGLLLTGSIAHGFANAVSDVDIALIVSDADFQQRQAAGNTLFFSRELATYDEGYVDGKFMTVAFLEQVAVQGSDPARFAFCDAQILMSQIADLPARLERITRYPVAKKTERIQRFYAQVEAWHWFTQEARKKNNRYLLNTAVSKLVLFGGRMILAHNEILYPFHKWFLRVLESASERPADLMTLIDTILRDPTPEHITTYVDTIKNYRAWETSGSWGQHFLQDSEQNWLEGYTPVDDL